MDETNKPDAEPAVPRPVRHQREDGAKPTAPAAPPDDSGARIKALEALVASMGKQLGRPVEPAVPRPVRHQREEDARVLASLRRLNGQAINIAIRAEEKP